MTLKTSDNRPLVLDHQAIRFETAQSWNPGKGNTNHPGTGNDGVNWPGNNPNPTPGGAGAPGKGAENRRK
ncbi:hypothetical protein [Metabacillus litoralis]|uniref:hypothetical protein n=1 Tax=Metabacillus litoralis TaxID=152268 RepID=UPI000EF59074|nr:hypothetical protein [Metabacillus litoralis]